VTINVAGHGLPAALAHAITSVAWPTSVPDGVLEGVFGEAPDPNRGLYSLAVMAAETTAWQSQTNPAYLGIADDDLDPKRSILIGDLGIDRPFGLDLRTCPPCVRFLRLDGRWVRIADSVEDLLERIGI
jgi:hypothetical protein